MKRPNIFTAIAARDWLLYLLLLPVLVGPVAEWGWLLLLIPCSWLLHWLAYGRPLIRTPLDLPLLLLAIMTLVGWAVSFDPALSWPKVAGLLFGLAFTYRIAALVQRGRWGLETTLAMILLFGWAIIGLSLVGAAWPRELPLVGALLTRLPGASLTLPGGETTGYNPNEIAGVLLWVTPLALALAWGWLSGNLRWPTLGRWQWPAALLWLLSALAFGLTLVLSRSRGGLLGLACGLALLTILAAQRRRRLLLGMMGTTFLAILAAVTYYGPAASFDRLLGVNRDAASTTVASLAGRTEVWSRALYGIADFPVTGMGVGTFRELVSILYPFFLIPPTTDIAHAHNLWLQTALDVGLPGLVAFIALWLGLGGLLWRIGRSATTAQQRWIAYGLAATLLAYFVFGLLDTVALGARPGFVFWTLAGLTIGLHGRLIILQPIVEKGR